MLVLGVVVRLMLVAGEEVGVNTKKGRILGYREGSR